MSERAESRTNRTPGGGQLIRDRIIDFRRVRAGDLAPNPKNFRRHPKRQLERINAALREIGFVGALLTRVLEDGSLMLLDGHARQSLHPDTILPVLVSDLTEAEVPLFLATFDELAAEAEKDAAALDELLREVTTGEAQLQEMLAEMAVDAGLDYAGPDFDVDPDAENENTGAAQGEPPADEDAGDDPDLSAEEKGSILAKIGHVVIADPTHQPARGDVYRLGRHTLVIADVMREAPVWLPLLIEQMGVDLATVFLPYPGPCMPLSSKAATLALFMVQPDRYVAGHMLDRYAAVHGEDAIERETDAEQAA